MQPESEDELSDDKEEVPREEQCPGSSGRHLVVTGKGKRDNGVQQEQQTKEKQ